MAEWRLSISMLSQRAPKWATMLTSAWKKTCPSRSGLEWSTMLRFLRHMLSKKRLRKATKRFNQRSSLKKKLIQMSSNQERLMQRRRKTMTRTRKPKMFAIRKSARPKKPRWIRSRRRRQPSDHSTIVCSVRTKRPWRSSFRITWCIRSSKLASALACAPS